MNTWLRSWSVVSVITIAVGLAHCSLANAQQNKGAAQDSRFMTDPTTGIVYQKVVRSVEKPVWETKTETQQKTVYVPKTVTETVPRASNVFVPETDYVWQPVLHGRWNPFQQPTITYHHVPRTQWKQTTDVTTQTRTRVDYVAQTRTVQVPKLVASIKHEEQIDYVPVGRMPDPAGATQAAPRSNLPDAVAARLQPVAPNTQVDPIAGSLLPRPELPTPIFRGQYSSFASRQYNQYNNPSVYTGRQNAWTQRGTLPSTNPVTRAPITNTQVAKSMGRMTGDPPRRSVDQGGIRATDLYPAVPGYSQPLPPSSAGTGIANLQGWSLWR